MVNRRILLFALIAIIGFTLISYGSKFVANRVAGKDDEIEIIRSDEYDIELVEEEGMRKTVLYYKNREGFLVPVMRRIPWEEGIAKVTLMNMIDSAEIREVLEFTGLSPLIPAGTEILGMTIDPDTGVCKVDFSENILNNESLKEEDNMIKGIVYTLTEFPAIEKVKIMVGGKALNNLTHGTNTAQNLSRENINLVGNLEEGKSKVVVYYKGSLENEFDYFIPVTIPTLAPMANVYTALDLLFEGPPINTDLTSDLPSGISLHGVEIKDGIAFVDISMGEISSLTEQRVINDLIKNIGLTLGEFEDIDTVELLLDGQSINATIPVFANEY